MKQFNINTGSNETFVVFHGTGGNEYSMLQFVGDLNKEANYRAYIGDVGTGAKRRFNLPLQNGQLNRQDFNARIDAFLQQWETEIPEGNITFLGYSNGANFIVGLLERNPSIADQIILLKPSNLGFTFETGSKAKIIITAGARDTQSIPGETMKLAKHMQEQFPNTVYKLLDHGHGINDEEIQAVARMLRD